MGETYSLGTILAIAIPLGVVCLISILVLMILALRYSCIAARERRAYNMIRSGDYRRSVTSSSLKLDRRSNSSKEKDGHRTCAEILCCIPSLYPGRRSDRRSPGSHDEKNPRRSSGAHRSNQPSHPLRVYGSEIIEEPINESMSAQADPGHGKTLREGLRETHADTPDHLLTRRAAALPTSSPLGPDARGQLKGTRLPDNDISSGGRTPLQPSVAGRHETHMEQLSASSTDYLSAFDLPTPPAPLFRGQKTDSPTSSSAHSRLNQYSPASVSSKRPTVSDGSRSVDLERTAVNRPARPAKSILRNKNSVKSLATQRSKFSNTPQLIEELKESEINSAASIATHDNISGKAESDHTSTSIPPAMEASTMAAPNPVFQSPTAHKPVNPVIQDQQEESRIAAQTPRSAAGDIVPSDTTRQRITDWFRASLDAPPRMPFMSSVYEPHNSAMYAETPPWSIGDETENWWLRNQPLQQGATVLEGGLESVETESSGVDAVQPEVALGPIVTPGEVSRERLLGMLQRNECIQEGSERVGRTEVGPSCSKFHSFTGSVVGAGLAENKLAHGARSSQASRGNDGDVQFISPNHPRYRDGLGTGFGSDEDTEHQLQRGDGVALTEPAIETIIEPSGVYGLRINQEENVARRFAYNRETPVFQKSAHPRIEQETHVKLGVEGEREQQPPRGSNLVQYRTRLASPLLLSRTELSHSSRSSSLTSSSFRLQRSNSARKDVPIIPADSRAPAVDFTRVASQVRRPDPMKTSASIREIASLREPESPRSPGYEPGQRLAAASDPRRTRADTATSASTKSRGHRAKRHSTFAYKPGNAASSSIKIKSKTAVGTIPVPRSAKINKPLPSTPLMLDEGVISNLGGSKFTAIHPYTAQLADELSLNPGDTVRVFEVFDDGWCLARIVENSNPPPSRTSRGVCPRSCLSSDPTV